MDVTAPLEQALPGLVAAEQAMAQRRDQLARAVATVDEAFGTIDRARDEVDDTLGRLPALEGRLRQRAARPDVSAAAPNLDAPGWVEAEVSVGDVEFRVVLDGSMHDPVTSNLAAGRASDEHLVELMLQLVRPGSHVVDLGAHVGVFSLAAAAAGCGVLAVEASPANAALCRASASRNGFHDLRIVNAAAGDTAGVIEFEANGPWGHIAWDGEGEVATIPVPAVTVDELLAAFAWPTPGFVKMDVEGSELKAIEGMRHLLEGPDAPPVLFESNGHALAFAGATPRDLLDAFESLGYATYLVDRARLTRVDPDQTQIETVAECLAVKRRPPGLGGWEVRPAMTTEDTLLKVVAECRHPNPDCRAYIARTLASFDSEILTHPLVASSLEKLRSDPEPDVRAAAAWSQPS